MDKSNKLSDLKPILTLYVLSPLIAELLFGSTPVSRSVQLIFESLLYGSGVLLVREFARRQRLGWTSIILLGIAFGVVEECILLQSAFNPQFLGNDLSFGRSGGVNWVWGQYIIGYHAIWSIAIPILVAELIYPDRKTQPWLNKTGIAITSSIYLFSCVAFYSTFVKLSGFTTSFIHYLVAGVLAFVLIVLAVYLPSRISVKSASKKPAPFVIGIIAFAGSTIWLILFSLLFKQGVGLPAWIVQLSGILIVLILFFFLSGWVRQNWNENHWFSVAFGCLMASMIFGLTTLIQSGNQLDIASQVAFILITTGLMFLLYKRLIKRNRTII
ncbi:MAG TPA: hypothetical protein VGK38_12750 [Prolixibacteraceae bacterium]|jgi:hypothetical protein